MQTASLPWLLAYLIFTAAALLVHLLLGIAMLLRGAEQRWLVVPSSQLLLVPLLPLAGWLSASHELSRRGGDVSPDQVLFAAAPALALVSLASLVLGGVLLPSHAQVPDDA